MNYKPCAPARAAVAIACVLLASCGGGQEGNGTTPASTPSAAAGPTKQALQALPAGTPIPADAPAKGMFGPLQAWPLIPVHVVLTPDGRVLSYGTKADGTQTGNFIYDVWDGTGGSHLTLANGSGTDIFCSSQILLPAGDTVSIAGGDNWTGTATTNTGNNNSNTYSVGTQKLTRGVNMNRARWYASSTNLPNGETLIQGGSGGQDRPEVRTTNGSFRLLSTADTSTLDPTYPRNFVAPDGRVFGFDSAGRMYWVDTSGTGSVTAAGQFTSAVAGADATTAMFRPGRVLQFGGNSKSAITIDINSGTPVVAATGSLAYQRRLGTAAILPNGNVLASGGSSVYNETTASNAASIVAYPVETWNPQTGTWTLGAAGVRSRLYHSVSLLMPDATVLIAGGGAPGPEVNTNAEIYYPSYLFAANATFAPRPAIDTAPTVVDPGKTMQLGVTSGRPIARVTMVATGAVTHTWNMSQRFVELPINVSGNTVSAQVPARATDVPPGMWMVFAIDDAGVPSIAKIVRVNVAATPNAAVVPVLAAPGAQTGTVGTAASLQLSATDPNGDVLGYSASGLPPGLALNPATGLITGTPTASGSYAVTVAASDGVNNASASFTWTVNAATGGFSLTLGAAPAPVVAGGTASLAASATGSNVTYSWDFGDGSAPTAPSASGAAAHAYASPGVWYATVTATSGTLQQSQTVAVQVYRQPTAGAPVASAAMLLEPRSGANPRLWVVNPDSDSVSVFDAVTNAKLAEISVETSPRSIARAPNGNMWVTNKAASSVNVISPTTLAVTAAIGLPRAARPHGMAMASASGSALVVLEATGQLAKINTANNTITALLDVGPNPRHVSVAADGRMAYVSRFITRPVAGESTPLPQPTGGGEVVVVDSTTMTVQRTITLAQSTKTDAENQGRGLPNYLGAAAISPDGTQAWVPGKQDNILRGSSRDGLALNFQNTVRAISSRIDLAAQAEDLGARVDHDNASLASAAAYDPLGVYLFVALETSREVAVLDAARRTPLLRIDVGRAPQALAVSADRRTLYVQNFMDRTVSRVDLTPLVQQGLASAPVTATLASSAAEPLSPAVLKGKQFFYDARDTRLARDRYMSCASCHSDGGHDGRVWDLKSAGEGLRNTISLRGRSGMGHGFLHWSGNFDEVQDFEGQIRALAGGSGLMADADFNTGTRNQPLGTAKAGVSADLDALAAYVASLNSFDPSPYRPAAATLSTAAADGKTVFTSRNCASCHGGSAFTNSGAANLANVGTIKAASGTRLFATLSGIDIPTLRDAWATGPYLHDGSAPTLEAAITAHTTLGVSAADATRLAAYLREIGSDEGSAPAPSGTGLMGQYFNGTALAGSPLLTRIEAVNFNWGTAAPAAGVPPDNYSVRWTGTVTAASTGTYRFRTNSDDGVRLWVDGVLRIDNWTLHGATLNTSASISLAAGRHTIRLEYYEATGSAVMQLQWQRPGSLSYVAIPAASLNAN